MTYLVVCLKAYLLLACYTRVVVTFSALGSGSVLGLAFVCVKLYIFTNTSSLPTSQSSLNVNRGTQSPNLMVRQRELRKEIASLSALKSTTPKDS